MTTPDIKREAFEAIAARFRSGNHVPVEKAIVPAAEWHALVAALGSMGAPSEAAEHLEILRHIIKCDDDAKSAHGKPHANLNGYGLVDVFDIVNHPFGVGQHRQQPYRSNDLDAALEDARAALAKARGTAS